MSFLLICDFHSCDSSEVPGDSRLKGWGEISTTVGRVHLCPQHFEAVMPIIIALDIDRKELQGERFYLMEVSLDMSARVYRENTGPAK